MSKATIVPCRTLNGAYSTGQVSSSVFVSKRKELTRSVEIQRSVTQIEDPLAGNINREKLFRVWPIKSAHVIREMLITEKGYIQSLHEVIQGYLKPLYEYMFSASQGAKFMQTVFCNIQKLHNINIQFFDSLICSYDNPPSFGKVFVNSASSFQEYTHYCTNFPKCEELLQHVMKSEPATRDFIIHCQLNIGHPLPLITYLHKPVQRILKYRLLLEQALKGMSENMQGFTELKEAVQTMISIAKEINEVKRKNENLQRVESIQKSLKGLKSTGISGGDLRSCGNLVFEEKCKVLGRGGGERIMMLFEACLLFLKTKGSDGYIYKGHILVEELDLCDIASIATAFKVFSVYRPSQPIMVQVKTNALKESVVDQIQSLLVKDLSEQKTLRESWKKKKEERVKEEHSSDREEEKLDPQSANITKLAHKKSLLASELQSRRLTRQISTRKRPDTSELSDVSSCSNSSLQMVQESVSGDSGIGTSISSSSSPSETGEEENREQTTRDNEEEPTRRKFEGNDKRLKRRTAIRRKETSKDYQTRRRSIAVSGVSEPPATVSCTYQLNAELSWSTGSTSSESFESSYEEMHSLESSLDKGGLRRDLDSMVESSLNRERRTTRFMQAQPLDKVSSTTVRDRRRPRSEAYSILPDPGLLGKVSVNQPLDEDDEECIKAAVTNGTSAGDPTTLHYNGSNDDHCLTLRVVSKNSELSEDSLCSNVSPADDHYYLSTMSKSSIIAGKDGGNITIYDEDSDDSEGELENGEEQTEQRMCDGDMAEKSLRSYLSRAKLWGSQDNDECAMSPLATLPRTSNAGPYSKLHYRQKPKLANRKTVDTLKSLPIDTPTTVQNGKVLMPVVSPQLNRSASLDNLQSDDDDAISFSDPQETSLHGTERIYQINTLPIESPSPISNTSIILENGWEIGGFEDMQIPTVERNETSQPLLEELSQSQEHQDLETANSPLDFVNLDELISLATEVNHMKINEQSLNTLPEADHQTTTVEEEFKLVLVETLESEPQSVPVTSNDEHSTEFEQATSNSINLQLAKGRSGFHRSFNGEVQPPDTASRHSPSPVCVSASNKAVNVCIELNSLSEPYEHFSKIFEMGKKISEQSPSDSKLYSSEVTHRPKGIHSNYTPLHSISSETSQKQLVKEDKGRNSPSQIIHKESLSELETMAMAKITLGVLSTFIPSLQQSALICVVIIAVLFFLYINRSYIASLSFGRDLVK